MKNPFFYLITISILFYTSESTAEKCNPEFFKTEFRNYNTVYIDLNSESLDEKESIEINTIILNQLKRLPNNIILKSDFNNNKTQNDTITPDRLISGKIKKTIIKKEKFAGETGKDQYLIKMYELVFYEIEIEVKETPQSNTIYKYKKYFKENELKKSIVEIYKEIEPLYAMPVQFCLKKEITRQKDYFINLYIINGFPFGDYREFLSYSFGTGGMFGVKGIVSENLVLSAYIETAYNTTDNTDINYAMTLQSGIGTGYSLDFKSIRVIPEISIGCIYSFYNVKYSDMDRSYTNIVFRSAVEINTGLFEKTFFIKPVISNIFEEGNTLHSIDLLLGIKILL